MLGLIRMLRRIKGEIYAKELDVIYKHFSDREIETVLNSTNKRDVNRYYLLNRMFYKRYVSRDGYMHYPLDGDIRYQVKRIGARIQSIKTAGMKVLELGAGNGANTGWLAKRNPDIYFLTTDISNPGPMARGPNIKHALSDYHFLDNVPDGVFDVAFAIETLCYSNQKEAAFQAIAKKLKLGGQLIVFDGYSREIEKMTEEERYVRDLWAAGMAIDELATLSWFREAATKQKIFELSEIEDLSDLAHPFSDYLTKNSMRFFNDASLKIRIARRLSPLTVKKNAITGLLNRAVFKHKLCYYYMHVFTRN